MHWRAWGVEPPLVADARRRVNVFYPVGIFSCSASQKTDIGCSLARSGRIHIERQCRVETPVATVVAIIRSSQLLRRHSPMPATTNHSSPAGPGIVTLGPRCGSDWKYWRPTVASGSCRSRTYRVHFDSNGRDENAETNPFRTTAKINRFAAANLSVADETRVLLGEFSADYSKILQAASASPRRTPCCGLAACARQPQWGSSRIFLASIPGFAITSGLVTPPFIAAVARGWDALVVP